MAININKSTIKLYFKIPILNLHFASVLSKNPSVSTLGITNECEDLYYIPYIDYDNIYYKKVKKEMKLLQREFNINYAIMLSTKEDKDQNGIHGNYHAIFLDKMKFSEIQEILAFTSCDPNFKRVPYFFRYKHWVLRIFPKFDKNNNIISEMPILKEIIKPANINKNKCSKAHYLFLRKYYKIPRLNLNFDNHTVINQIKYKTTEGGWIDIN